MTRYILLALFSLFLITPAWAAESNAHRYMNNVDKSFAQTPDHQGLLEVAMAEARTARTHAGLAAQKTGDLDWMKTHTGHVRHALTGKGKGPGLGYGLIRACKGAIHNIGQAAKAKDTTANIKLHSRHVRAATTNALRRAEQMLAVTKRIENATTAAQAGPLVEQLKTLAGQVLDGEDRNGDGQISWQEGGLVQASQHMGYMRKGESQ